MKNVLVSKRPNYLFLILLMLLTFSYSSQAQIKIGSKLKDKIEKKAKKKKNKKEKEPKSVKADSKTDTDSPAAKEIKAAERTINSIDILAAKGNKWKVSGERDFSAMRTKLTSLNRSITKIKEKDPSYDVSKYENKYKSFTKQQTSKSAEPVIADSKTNVGGTVDAESPAIRDIKAADRAINGIKGIMAKGDSWKSSGGKDYGSVTRKLKELERSIERIKEKDASYTGITSLESTHKSLAEKQKSGITKHKNKFNYYSYFKELRSDLSNLMREVYPLDIEKYKITSYKDYQDKKSTYKSSGSTDESTNKIVAELEALYGGEFSKKYTPKFKKAAESDTKRAFEEKSWKQMPKDALKELSSVLDAMEIVKTITANRGSDFADLEQKYRTHKQKIEQFMKGGGVDQFKKDEDDRRKEELRMKKPKLKDAKLEAFIKSYAEGEYTDGGKVIKVVITSKDWYVRKNALGVPTQKDMEFQLIKKVNGQCYLQNGDLKRIHEGGGNYGSNKIYLRYLQAINCDNINK